MTDIISKENIAPWSTYFQYDAFNIEGEKIMGRQAAGHSYLKGLANQGYDTISFYIRDGRDREQAINLIQPLLKKDSEINFVSWKKPNLSQKFGGIFFSEPKIGIQSIFRSKYNHDSYSLVGLTHTTASDAVMDTVLDYLTKPIKPWDAVICTSQCVKDTLSNILDQQKDFLKSEIKASEFQLPQLPIIPLGINSEDFDYKPDQKNTVRRELGIEDDDIVFVFVGRLSFHAKSHHFPMFWCLNEISKELDKNTKIHLLLTGWFGNDNIKEIFVNEHKILAPNIQCHLIDGRDQNNKHKSLSCADIFISLSDNYQETFGLTPLEGMAAGLPVIVSDWNGYRETVRHEKDGFMIPTMSLGKGHGDEIIDNYRKGIYTYDYYVGYTSQLVSVDIESCLESLRKLIKNKDLRKKMGSSGRERARSFFDWKHVLSQYSDLKTELNDIRQNDSKKYNVKSVQSASNIDPFILFETYPTNKLSKRSQVKKSGLELSISIDEVLSLQSVKFAFEGDGRLLEKKDIKNIFDSINNKYIFLEILQKQLKMETSGFYRSVMWMHKFGLLKIK